MPADDAFQELLNLAEKLNIKVRHVRLGGTGGGLAQFKGQRQLFIDQDAAPIDQLDQTVHALVGLEEIATLYVRPDVRQLLDECAASKSITTHVR